jgi:hypothetical protein
VRSAARKLAANDALWCLGEIVFFYLSNVGNVGQPFGDASYIGRAALAKLIAFDHPIGQFLLTDTEVGARHRVRLRWKSVFSLLGEPDLIVPDANMLTGDKLFGSTAEGYLFCPFLAGADALAVRVLPPLAHATTRAPAGIYADADGMTPHSLIASCSARWAVSAAPEGLAAFFAVAALDAATGTTTQDVIVSP